MSNFDQNNNIQLALSPELSLLCAAEIALWVGACFGFLAVLSLVLISWTHALIATVIAVAAMVAAMVLLSIPRSASKQIQERRQQTLPKSKGVVENYDFIRTPRRISKSITPLRVWMSLGI